jgi:hypothetical protein
MSDWNSTAPYDRYGDMQDLDDGMGASPAVGVGPSPSMLRRPAARQPSLPHGYDIRPVTFDDRYDTLDNRDYTRISFGTLISEDYGRLISPDLPLGNRDDSADPYVNKIPPEDDLQDAHDRGLKYSQQLTLLRPTEAATLGLEPDLVMTERQREFCEEFLGFMAVLGHEGAEELQLGNVPRGPIAGASEWLARKLSPSCWKMLGWNDRSCEEAGERPLSAAYQGFLGRVAAGETVDNDPELVKAYPLQKLNHATWLYLCEDGLIRAKVEASTLLPPPTPGFTTGPTARLHCDYDAPRADYAQRVTHEIVNKTSGEVRAFKFLTFPARVLAYPPKQRLVDIAGRAITRLSATA